MVRAPALPPAASASMASAKSPLAVRSVVPVPIWKEALAASLLTVAVTAPL